MLKLSCPAVPTRGLYDTGSECEPANQLMPLAHSRGCCAVVGAWLPGEQQHDSFSTGWSTLDVGPLLPRRDALLHPSVLLPIGATLTGYSDAQDILDKL